MKTRTGLIVGLFFVWFFTIPVAALANDDLPITPLLDFPPIDQEKANLGRKLFFEKRLSKNNEISCATCHDLDHGGTRPQRFSMPGISGIAEPINIPTVFNAGLNFVQFWDGRAETLQTQIDGPVHNPNEMGSNWKEIEEKLNADDDYRKLFENIYRAPAREQHIKDAIKEFQTSLMTPNTPFDRFLNGEKDAISEGAQKGFQLFKELGCISCHQGVNLGGNMYQKLGLIDDYFAERGEINNKDLGRYNVTNNPDDIHVFKVPSLRHIALTPPYLHDGSAATLEDAIDIMARFQLGHDLTPEQRAHIISFLKTLHIPDDTNHKVNEHVQP